MINGDKLMMALNNKEYGALSKRLKNSTTYPIMQKLLPKTRKIRKLVINTNKNHDISIDTLIKKKFNSKLNERVCQDFKIMITNLL